MPNLLPPAPRPVPPAMRRSLRFLQGLALVFIGGVIGGIGGGLIQREEQARRGLEGWFDSRNDDPPPAIWFLGAAVSAALSAYFHLAARRERHLLIHGEETIGVVQPDTRGVRFMARSQAIFHDGLPYDIGAVSGRGPLLYDVANPKRMTPVRIEMLPLETLRTILPRPPRPLLDPAPRRPNPAWMRNHRPLFWIVTLWGAIGSAVVVGFGSFAVQLTSPREQGCLAVAVIYAVPALLVAAAAWVLMLRARARTAALWRDGIETRARVTHLGATSATFQLAAGDILVRGSRTYDPGRTPLRDAGTIVVLVDPLDAENRTTVLVGE